MGGGCGYFELTGYPASSFIKKTHYDCSIFFNTKCFFLGGKVGLVARRSVD